MTPKIVLYTKSYCSFCKRAKAMLKKKGVAFIEHEISSDPRRTAEMIERAGGRRTVPQIFIDDRHIGGASDMFKLDAAGELDPLLNLSPAT